MQDFLDVLEKWDDEHPSQVEKDFVSNFFFESCDQLEEVLAGADDDFFLPTIRLIDSGRPGGGMELSACEDGSVQVGMGFLLGLHRQVLMYTDWLASNFVWQVAPLLGDIPPLSELVGADEFPSKALTFFSEELIPGAVENDGYERSVFENVILGMDRVLSQGPEGGSHAIAKPHIDVEQYTASFNKRTAIERFSDEASADHLRNLYSHLMNSCFQFALTHEIAHIQLGHVDFVPSDSRTAREQEVEADTWGFNALRHHHSFDLRALFAIFGFFNRQADVSKELNFLTHPLHPDRMLALAAVALRHNDDRSLRNDISAGMSIVRTELAAVQLKTSSFIDGREDQHLFTLVPSFRSNMENGAFLRLEIHLPDELQTREFLYLGDFILQRLLFRVEFSLRSMVNPSDQQLSGSLELRLNSIATQKRYARSLVTSAEVLLQALPEWWLEWPESVFVIDDVQILDDAEPPAEAKGPVEISILSPDFRPFENMDDVFNAITDKNPNKLLRVADSAFSSGREPLAFEIFSAVYKSNPTALNYNQVTAFIGTLLQVAESGVVSYVAESWHASSPKLRPGLSSAIAFDAAALNEWPKATEYAALEMFGIGKYGGFTENAQELYSELVQSGKTPYLAHLRDYHRNYIEYQKLEEKNERLAALAEALRSIGAAKTSSDSKAVFLYQFAGETLVEMAELGDDTWISARREFQLALDQEPRFAPAYLGLASVAFGQGDEDSARRLWAKAREVSPVNSFVLNYQPPASSSST